MSDLRYPIGKFTPPNELTESALQTYIQELKHLPALLAEAVEGLSNEQLDTPYRDGGWTIRQVVHHLADGHLNTYMRVRSALTEEDAKISDYLETQWAELWDAKHGPIEPSLAMLQGIHQRWSTLLQSLSGPDWKRVFIHPARGRVPVDMCTAMYVWHGKHHLAHITSLCERKGWK